MIETVPPRGMVGPRLLPGSSLRAGDVIGSRYRVELVIRDGRASARFLGLDTKTNAPVCIEIVTGASEEADAVGVRFLSSARRVANLKSAHLARVLDAGVTTDGHPYVVTEALAGETLAKALELRGSAPTAEAIDIAIDICEALAEAHANGLLHGDLTTEAIQASPEVKVVGVGTTHATLALRPTEELGIRAPEQLDPANAIDEKTDVWGVGVILYTMLAGAAPFVADSPSTQNVALALDEPPQLAGVPDALADIVDSCLAKNPVLRPHTIKRLAEELAPFASDPHGAAVRIACWEEIAPQSSPTLVAVVYEALRKEKEESVLGDADSTAPRTALAREVMQREGAVVSDPRLGSSAAPDSSAREMMKSEPPPAVVRTLPPPQREIPTVFTRRPAPKWRLGMHPMTLVGATACLLVATFIAACIIRREEARPAAETTAAAVDAPASPPPAPEPRESPPPAAAPITPASTGTVIAASALPEAPTTAPPPAKRIVKKTNATPSAEAAPRVEEPKKPVTHQPATEPKADDDLRKFLDDRR